MTRSGFTLIEFILALLFSAIILTTLFTSFFQLTRSTSIAEDVIDVDTRIAVITHQLEKDLSGCFVPIQALMQEPKKEEKKAEEAEAVKKEKAQEKKKAEEAGKEKEKEKVKIKQLKDVFYSANKNEFLNELTFITNNPMRVYEHAKNAFVKPRIVRVVYRLIPHKEKKDIFILLRQEGAELDFGAYKKEGKIRSYEIADNIKSIKIEFKIPKIEEKEKKETEAQKPPAKEEKKPIVYETLKEWRSNEIQEKKKNQSLLPHFITITITLWDNEHEQERSVQLNISLVAFGQDVIKKPGMPTEKTEPKKEEEKKEAEKKAQEIIKRGQARLLHKQQVNEVRASMQELMKMLDGKSGI
jgi:hypothetical protein